jgi:hypothetical protein
LAGFQVTLIGRIWVTPEELYSTTCLETNPAQLERLIAETKAAIFLRLQELAMSSNGAGERHDIEAATAGLLSVKIEKLHWPDTRKS